MMRGMQGDPPFESPGDLEEFPQKPQNRESVQARPELDCSLHMPGGAAGETAARGGLSQMALGLVGSEILKIAASVRTLQAQGRKVCNLTVGDFLPREFPIPDVLQAAITRAYERRETNYPPSDGMPQAREAVVDFYKRALGLCYPLESVVICGGARPAIYGTYRALIEPGDRVIYPTPSWNNNHYIHLCGGVPVDCPTRPEDGFMPTAQSLAPLLSGARLLCLNSPLNPTGTVISKSELLGICQLILDENRRRAAAGQKPLYLLYDQVYFMLTFGGVKHYTPPELLPEMSAYTIFVDAISKSLCATGLRVGWAVAPPYVTARMRDILGHVGAWAPRPEQLAAAEVLRDLPSMAAFHREMTAKVQQRLDLLYSGFVAMMGRGLPVRAIPPQGAIYLSVQFALHGRRTRAGGVLTSNEDIRGYLLDVAGMAVVPFQAFGMREESGWMRLSVGAVSPAEIAETLPRLEAALSALSA
jgi:aspartate aminotransferase